MAKAPKKITLAQIADAGENGMYVLESSISALINDGLVETDGSVNDDGEKRYRASDKGKANISDKEPKTATVKTAFSLDDDVPMPVVSASRGRTETYPFDLMNVNQSFFVANSEDKKDAYKSLGSTVSGANQRYAVPDESGATKQNRKGETVPVMVFTRRFVIKRVTENGIDGARIWRVQ